MSVILSNTFIEVPRCTFTHGSLKMKVAVLLKVTHYRVHCDYKYLQVWLQMAKIEMGCNFKKRPTFSSPLMSS